MPPPNYSPYQEANAAVSGLGNAFNNVAIGVAQQRLAQQQAQQLFMLRTLQEQRQAALAKEQARTFGARTALLNAQAVLEGLKSKQLERAGAARSTISDLVTALPNITQEQDQAQHWANIAAQFPYLNDSERNQLVPNIAQARAMAMPGLPELIATDTKARISVGPGGGVFNPIAEKFSMMPQQLGRGETLVDPTSGQPIATGMGYDLKNLDTPNLLKYFASQQSSLGHLESNPGIKPGDPEVMRRRADLKAIAEILNQRLLPTTTNVAPAEPTIPPGTNAPLAPLGGAPATNQVAPQMPQFRTEAEAKAAGMRKGSRYLLFDQMSNKFRPWQQDTD